MVISQKLIAAIKLSPKRAYKIAWEANVNPTVLSKLINGIERPKPHDKRIINVGKVLGIPEDEFLVTYVGRVAPEKGVDVFVRAIEMASRQIPVKADAIGSLSGHFGSSTRVTEYAARVQNASPDTRFRGFIHRDEPEYRLRLAAADAVVIPSLTEPFGLVVLEALACGARVIGSDVGGVRDTLAHDVGRLVPPGDAQALAASIVGVYESGAEARCSVHGRKALKKFRWANIAEQYLTTMEAVLGPREHEDA